MTRNKHYESTILHKSHTSIEKISLNTTVRKFEKGTNIWTYLLKPSKLLYGPWFPCVFDDSSSPQDQAASPSLLPMS